MPKKKIVLPVKEYYQPDLSTFHVWMAECAAASRAARPVFNLPPKLTPARKKGRK